MSTPASSPAPGIDIGSFDTDDLPEPQERAPRIKSPPHRFDPSIAGRNRAVGPGIKSEPAAPPAVRVDGRSARATGRAAQMNIKVTEDVREAYVSAARRLGVALGQLVQEGLELAIAKREGTNEKGRTSR